MEPKELAYRALDGLKENLDYWYQAGWDTCFASFVVGVAGEGEAVENLLIGYEIGVRAAELLGIGDADPEYTDPYDIPLFYADNTLEDLHRMVHDLFGERA